MYEDVAVPDTWVEGTRRRRGRSEKSDIGGHVLFASICISSLTDI